ncbi:MAG: phosphatidyl-myo-inositol dimannoside synthase [Blastocatellia bacterium]|jgi:glycosyltransferase involved in cell wall biosynthesis|nr:phosphatidyl-myo-inositol dimannoside synthase [Blastocatellia bacterium]
MPFGQPVLIASDRAEDIQPHAANLGHLAFAGFAGRRAAFATRAVRVGLKQETDLTLIGHINYAPIGLGLRKIKPGFRYGVMVHGVEVWSRLPQLKRMALQQADFITSVSEYTKQQIVEVNGVDPQRVYVLPNTIEWAGDSLKAQVSGLKPATKITLLSVGRLEASDGYKGVDHVIAALPEVIKRVPELEYVVIARGDDVARHKQLALEHGVAERVHFPGTVEPEKLRDAYRNSDVFIMPSAGEGFGIVFLEAMQYEKPVIAARSAAVPEVVIDDATGVLVEYGNIEQISNALIDLCLDAEKRKRLGQAGYQRLQDNFTFSQFKERLTEILNRELPQGSEAAQPKAVISAPPAATPTGVE